MAGVPAHEGGRRTSRWRYSACGLGVLAFSGFGQGRTPAAQPVPVLWRMLHLPPKPVRARETFRASIVASIAPGWHLYALEEPAGGPVETVLGLQAGDPATLLHVDQGQPDTVLDPAFGQRTELFREKAEFTLLLRLAKSATAGNVPLHVQVRYQACGTSFCLPPQTSEIVLNVPVQP